MHDRATHTDADVLAGCHAGCGALTSGRDHPTSLSRRHPASRGWCAVQHSTPSCLPRSRYRLRLALGVEFEISEAAKERSEDILGDELGGP